MRGRHGRGPRHRAPNVPSEIRPLESFLAVADCGNLTAAARRLGLTQPGLSRQIQRLERSLGTALFVRAHNGVRLTPAGERYRAFSADVVARHRQLLDEVRGTLARLEGTLRVAASSTPGEFLVPRFLADFSERHPDVRPVVFLSDSEAVVNELLERRWDLGFVGARIDRDGLRYSALTEDEILLAVPAHHPFAAVGEIALDALGEQRFIDREGGSGTLLSVRRSLAARGLALPPHRIGMTLSTTQAVVSAVRAGCGIGFVSSLALAERSDGRVAGVRLAGIPLRRTLYLVYETRRVMTPAARGFSDFVLGAGPAAP